VLIPPDGLKEFWNNPSVYITEFLEEDASIDLMELDIEAYILAKISVITKVINQYYRTISGVGAFSTMSRCTFQGILSRDFKIS
jgi:hypothetical protein